MISYKPLWDTMNAKGISTYTLRVKMGFSPGTLTSLKQNRHVSTHTLQLLINILDCEVQDIIKITPDETPSDK